MSSDADDAIKNQAGRLYASMFGKLLEDDDETPSRIADRLFLGSAPDAHAHDLDHFDISSHFPAALNFIHKSLQADDGAVLVHCSAGVSRSATIVAAYLMVAHQIDATEAVQRVNQARPCACPNIGFIQQLLRFDHRDFKFD
ncbi:unnamed protein product [Adineta ricciae]|uniref:Uncharacterized protein n=1 Tax=Adineta ricciae TaxID=249248 RepID=A0A815NJI2_ADIRI|nr:unnamed protein product [Adineta ricciae]CAF1518415.1 unnamed protein product [Adineta ricciae]